MATRTKAGAGSANSSPAGGPFPFQFDVGNEPNADILLESLRSAGYGLESVVGDFVDNSIDAGASTIVVHIDIDLATEEWAVEVGDNGSGMDLQVLDQMMRLGSRTEHDLISDLGAFGLGSDTAALALGRNKHVITSYEPGSWASSSWDLDVIKRKREFVKHLGDARQEEVDLFRATFSKAGLKAPETGTLVRISKCDRVGRRQVGPAIRAVLKYLNETYRRFLIPNGGLTLFVNGQQAVPDDPLMRNHSETQILLDEQIDFEWKDEGSKQRSEKIGVLVVHLPDLGGPEANKDAGITIDRSGFYILRNGREISSGTTLGTFTRHNEFSRFRCELNIPATLDSQLGVTFLKSSFELRPTQALRDKIEHAVGPYRRQSRKLYLKSRPSASEQVPHEEAAKQIKARSPFLRKPVAEIERRSSREKRSAQPNAPRPSAGTRVPRSKAQRALADVAQFEARALGPTAPFYEGALTGRKVLVTYNSDHPAYQRLILDNKENRAQITAIDFLVWSMVAAELRNVDDDSARFMEGMREDASFNLRQLLTT